MPRAYAEDQLVEQPAIGLFAELGPAVKVPPRNAGVAGESIGYFSMRYKCVFVRRNSALPATAGEAMKPSASWFSASFLN